MLSRDDILGADDLQRELVQVPEWGGDVYVRCLTGAERDLWETHTLQDVEPDAQKRYANFRARLVVMAVCDDRGMPVFMLADASRLGQKSGKVLDRLYEVAVRLSGIRQEDVDALTKNSVATPPGASGSDSP
jgi:hypothetical protein